MPNPKAVPIQPKPANDSGSAGAASQRGPTRKQRAGPLVFVNSSDMNTDSEKRGNRKTVKKWAMLNRNSRHLQPSSSHNGAQSQFLSWDLKTAERDSSSASPDEDETATTRTLDSALTTLSENSKRSAPRQPSIRLMGEAVTNQFNNLAVEADPHAKTLIEWFLKGGRGDIETPGGRLSTCNRLAFPMIAQSPAALCSLIAALEANPFSPIRSANRAYRDHWLSMALSNTNSLLQGTKASREVFMCVSFLMWIAHHMGDHQALRVHITGYAALIVRHWDLFTSTPYFRNGPFFWTFPSNEGNILPETRTPPQSKQPSPEQERYIHHSIFAQLQADGYLSTELLLFMPHLLAMQAMIPAKAGQLDIANAKDLLTYIWYNARTLVAFEDYALSRLEQCIRQTLIIFYYACLWRNPRDGVGWMVGSMQSHVSSSDLAWLMEDRPDVLLWFCLMGGHFSKDFSREWWLDLLVSVRHATGLSTFDEARQVMEERLLWTRWLDTAAEAFWNETSTIMQELRLPWQKET